MSDCRVFPSPGEIGGSSHRSNIEAPQCQDGSDNDLASGIGIAGGAPANAGVPLGPPDPQCTGPTVASEAPATGGCGSGPELMLLVPLLAALRRRRA